jgi:hypothetical protein
MPTTDPPISYDQHLHAVRQLGRLFPGYRSKLGHEHRELGLFAGIYLQTRWQRDSGRDRLPHWARVNESLTLAPYAYALEFLADPEESPQESAYVHANPTRDAAAAPVTQLDTCRAWKAYFRAAATGAPKRALRRALWHAHTTSMRHALWQHEAELAAAEVPPSELAFWRGWCAVVFELEPSGLPTTDLLLEPLLGLTMPAGSLTGATPLQALGRTVIGTFAGAPAPAAA